MKAIHGAPFVNRSGDTVLSSHGLGLLKCTLLNKSTVISTGIWPLVLYIPTAVLTTGIVVCWDSGEGCCCVCLVCDSTQHMIIAVRVCEILAQLSWSSLIPFTYFFMCRCQCVLHCILH